MLQDGVADAGETLRCSYQESQLGEPTKRRKGSSHQCSDATDQMKYGMALGSEGKKTASDLEPGRRIELLTYALRGGPGPCLAVAGADTTLLNRSYQNGRRVIPGRSAQFYGMNMG